MFRQALRLSLCLFVSLLAACSTAQVPPVEDQIGAAILAAPEEMKEGAAVLGYDRPGHIVQIREGSNDLICLTDNPDQEGFSVACYHKDLEPYMARGRELRAEGVGGGSTIEIRKQEVEAGDLFWPSEARTLYVRSGEEGAYDAATGTAEGSHLRYVIYVAFATPESTGLSAMPGAPGVPWLMDPGTFRAHIMVVPPRTDGDS